MCSSDLAQARRLSFVSPRIPLVSNLFGRPFRDGESPDAGYWRRHAREPVLFAEGLRALLEAGCNAFVEAGPDDVLCRLGKAFDERGVCWAPSCASKPGGRAGLLTALGRLFEAGADFNPAGVLRDDPQGRRVALPTTPFERQRYWVPDPGAPSARELQEPTCDVDPAPRAPFASPTDSSPLYRIVWRRAKRPAARTPQTGPWWILADAGGAAEALAGRMRSRGADVHVVAASDPAGWDDFLRRWERPTPLAGVMDARALGGSERCELDDPAGSAVESIVEIGRAHV